VGNRGASLHALSGYTKTIKISKTSHAMGGMDREADVRRNWDMGKPRTIKQRRHRVLPKADNKTLNSVAPIKAHALGVPSVCKNKKNSHDSPQASNAGNGQLRIFI
jgi:hypothetical protein